MTRFLITSSPAFVLLAGLFSSVCVSAQTNVDVRRLEDLSIFSQGFPRILFFRNSEALAVRGMPLEEYDALVNNYGGIIVKAFDEEKYGLSDHALDYFRGYKQRNPEQLVLLHMNGAARDPRPRSVTPEFFAGCWLHYNGCLVTGDLSAETTEIHVEDPSLFKMKVGKRIKLPDDVTICALKADGTPDWNNYEYAKIVAIDRDAKTLTVRRGMFGTQARQWKAGQAYIAAIREGGYFPLTKESEPQNMWFYNFSIDAPRDKRGRRLIEIFADELADKLNPGGPGEYFDGLTFDVMPWLPPQRLPKHIKAQGRGQDTDGDGQSDFGFRDGVNRYGAGVELFLTKLRERLGPSRLIMRDHSRRVNSALNGVESEGWPSPFDLETREWSSGVNDHNYWHRNSARPTLNYIHYKFAERRADGPNKRFRFSFGRARLIMGASQILGDALTTNNGPEPEADEQYGLFDELKMGVERRRYWLGQPVEPARALALDAPDLLGGTGVKMSPAFVKNIAKGDAKIEVVKTGDGTAIKASTDDAQAAKFHFALRNVPLDGPDLTLRLRLKADPMREIPADVARKITVTLQGRDWPESTPRNLFAWADEDWAEARFYYRGLKGATADFTITVEDSGDFYLAGVTAHAAPDIMTRAFEGGLVLVNPSLAPTTFDLAKLYPGQSFRRFHGSKKQDAETNNGQPVGATVTLGERDGLFIVREK